MHAAGQLFSHKFVNAASLRRRPPSECPSSSVRFCCPKRGEMSFCAAEKMFRFRLSPPRSLSSGFFVACSLSLFLAPKFALSRHRQLRTIAPHFRCGGGGKKSRHVTAEAEAVGAGGHGSRRKMVTGAVWASHMKLISLNLSL